MEQLKESQLLNLPVQPILGVNYIAADLNTATQYLNTHIDELRGQYAVLSNVHTTIMAYDDPAYKNILNSSAIAFPDGRPISVIQKRKGAKNSQQIAGHMIFDALMKNRNGKRHKHFFYGSTEKTLDILKGKLPDKYPNAEIVGYYSPPFRELTLEEDETITKMINDSQADFVWVGLGAPKQERWMFAHKSKINAFMLGVGAVFDFEAGNIKAVPDWMNKLCLGWLFRLIQEPKRLFMRYFVTNTKFLWLIAKGEA